MKRNRIIAAVALVILGTTLLSGCFEEDNDTAARTDQCGFVVGDGKEGRDADIHKVVYPGDIVKIDEESDTGDDTEVFKSFPCNSRNFIINPSGSKSANGDDVGDWHEPIQVVTKDGTMVNVWVTMLWTPNQTESVMKNQFFQLCSKYNCFDDGSSNNFSSAGWNGMLAENVPFAIAKSILPVMPEYDDAVWRNKSYWGDIEKVMELEEAKHQAQLQSDANDAQLTAAKKKYGDNAGAVLGNLDLIAACKEAGSTCVVTIGDGSAPTVVTPPATKQ